MQPSEIIMLSSTRISDLGPRFSGLGPWASGLGPRISIHRKALSAVALRERSGASAEVGVRVEAVAYIEIFSTSNSCG